MHVSWNLEYLFSKAMQDRFAQDWFKKKEERLALAPRLFTMKLGFIV